MHLIKLKACVCYFLRTSGEIQHGLKAIYYRPECAQRCQVLVPIRYFSCDKSAYPSQYHRLPPETASY